MDLRTSIILYNIFKEFLEDLDEDYMPNEATGFKDSIIWNRLYNFQKDGAVGCINKLEKYNGCILADKKGYFKLQFLRAFRRFLLFSAVSGICPCG